MDDGEDEAYTFERGRKSDSYFFAVNNNKIPLKLNPPLDDVIYGTELIISKKIGFLTYKDLELYCADSFWRRLRIFFLIAFWLIWILLFHSGICLIFVAPACRSVDTGKWWTSALIYELWTSSFQDSNGDGAGDLAGLKSRLANLRQIGVDTIFPRQLLHADFSGMGIVNFVKVDEKIGTFDDLDALIEECHGNGMKMIIDFPLVVTSSNHNWFLRSAHAHLPENGKFASFYYWKRNVLPSDFVAEYQNSSLFYFHVYKRPDLPVLNWNSFLVSHAIKRALSFWIDKGIDGIHFSSIDYLHRNFDGFKPEWDVIVNFLRGIREHVQEYSRKSNVMTKREIFIMASPGDLKEEQKRRLSLEGGFNGIMNTELSRIALQNRICYHSETTVASCVNEILSDLLRFYSTPFFTQKSNNETVDGDNISETSDSVVWPVWSFTNSLTSRMSSRLKSRRHAELLMMVELFIPGTPVVYYGEELGLEDCCYDHEKLYCSRGMMPWDSSSSHCLTNFSASLLNFKDELANRRSQLSTFKRLVRLRKNHFKVFGTGGAAQIGAQTHDAFALCRYSTTNSTIFTNYAEVFVMALNFGNVHVDLSLLDLFPFQMEAPNNKNLNLGRPAQILAVSSHSHHRMHEILHISTGKIQLGADEGILFRLI